MIPNTGLVRTQQADTGPTINEVLFRNTVYRNTNKPAIRTIVALRI